MNLDAHQQETFNKTWMIIASKENPPLDRKLNDHKLPFWFP